MCMFTDSRKNKFIIIYCMLTNIIVIIKEQSVILDGIYNSLHIIYRNFKYTKAMMDLKIRNDHNPTLLPIF